MAEPDFGLYPSRDMQMEWLRVYLQAFKLFTKNSEEEVSQQELETLYVQVNKFALVRTNPPTPPPYLPSVFSSQTRNVSHFSHLMFVSPGFPLLLGVLGSDPGQILLHHL